MFLSEPKSDFQNTQTKCKCILVTIFGYGIAWTWTYRTFILHGQKGIKNMMKTILVLLVGSADAKRGFSVMNHIKSSRRQSLTKKHLEYLMRIRLNGPDEIEKFFAAKYD